MWFKTKFGLVHLEGSFAVHTKRYATRGGMKVVAVYAYQYLHPEFTQRRFLRPAIRVENPSVFLAALPDDGTAERRVVECLNRMEQSIRNDESICDLSDIGTVESWGPGWASQVCLRP